MSAALTAYSHPVELVPGDLAGVREIASELGTLAGRAGDTSGVLRSIEAGSWVGPAGEAFRERIGVMPSRLDSAADAFHDAGRAFGGYADELAEARSQAARAIGLMGDADAATAAWVAVAQRYDAAVDRAEKAAEVTGQPVRTPGVGRPASSDPGEQLREQARSVLDDAREGVAERGRRAAGALRVAAEAAPDEPGLFSRALGQVGEFFKGAGEAVVGIAEFSYKLSPVYLLVDPEGYVSHLDSLRDGLVFAVQNPKEFALAVLDWETWKENPARALGRLVPDLLLAIATGGAGTVATRSAFALRTARRLDDVPTPGAPASRLDDVPAGSQPGRWDTPEAREQWVREQISPTNPDSQAASGSKPFDEYQRHVAGDTEVRLNPESPGDRIWADGVSLDPDAVAAVEAKYVGRPGASPYEGSAPAFMQDKLLEGFDDEMRRYAAAIADPNSPVERLRIVTNTDEAAAFLRERATRLLPPGTDLQVVVRSVP